MSIPEDICFQAPNGTPLAGDTALAQRMPKCDHCSAHVSDRFARVFADEQGQILACPSCSANAGIAEVSRERARDI